MTGSRVQKTAGSRRGFVKKPVVPSSVIEEDVPEAASSPVVPTPDSIRQLNARRDMFLKNVSSGLNSGEVNPKPSNNCNVSFKYNNFCVKCVDKMAEGIKRHGVSDKDAVEASKIFLRELNMSVSDHVSLEVFNRKGTKACIENDMFGGFPYEVSRIVDRTKATEGISVCENLLGEHAYSATMSTGIIYDDETQSDAVRYSDHSNVSIGSKLRKAIGHSTNGCSCMKTDEMRQIEKDDVEDLEHIASDSAYNRTADNGHDLVIYKQSMFDSNDDESESEDESEATTSDSETEGEDNDTEGETDSSPEPQRCSALYKRPSAVESIFDEISRGSEVRLCLSICRHNVADCTFNEANLAKIYNSVELVAEDDKEEKTNLAPILKTEIDGKTYNIAVKTSHSPSFCLGSSVFEVRAYSDEPLVVSIGIGVPGFNEEEMEDHQDQIQIAVAKAKAMVAGNGNHPLVDMASSMCDQVFAKPLGKAYLTVTTSATPWPCMLKTPPRSDVNVITDEGEYESFVVPLPFSYRGNYTNGQSVAWRSKMYSRYVSDRLGVSIRPVTNRRLVEKNNTDKSWSFSSRNFSDMYIKLYGSVIKSGLGDLDEPSLYFDNSHSASECLTVTAQSDFSEVMMRVEKTSRDLNSFSDNVLRDTFEYVDTLAASTNELLNSGEGVGEEDEKTKEAKKVMAEERANKFDECLKTSAFICEQSLKHENFKDQLTRQVNKMGMMCSKYVPGFHTNSNK